MGIILFLLFTQAVKAHAFSRFGYLSILCKGPCFVKLHICIAGQQQHRVATQGPGTVYYYLFARQRKVLVVKAAIRIDAELDLRRIGIRNTVGSNEITWVLACK